MKAYSQDLRDRVINTYKEGKYTKTAIAKRFHLAYDTACSWIKRYLTTGDDSSKQRTGFISMSPASMTTGWFNRVGRLKESAATPSNTDLKRNA